MKPKTITVSHPHINPPAGDRVMELKLHCAMCGAEKEISVEVIDRKIDAEEAVKRAGWISQQNGPNFDVYCSEKCAA